MDLLIVSKRGEGKIHKQIENLKIKLKTCNRINPNVAFCTVYFDLYQFLQNQCLYKVIKPDLVTNIFIYNSFIKIRLIHELSYLFIYLFFSIFRKSMHGERK